MATVPVSVSESKVTWVQGLGFVKVDYRDCTLRRSEAEEEGSRVEGWFSALVSRQRRKRTFPLTLPRKRRRGVRTEAAMLAGWLAMADGDGDGRCLRCATYYGYEYSALLCGAPKVCYLPEAMCPYVLCKGLSGGTYRAQARLGGAMLLRYATITLLVRVDELSGLGFCAVQYRHPAIRHSPWISRLR